MIRYEITKTALIFLADNQGRSDLAYAFNEGGYPRAESEVLGEVMGNGLEWIQPEEIGALTSAPIFGNDAERNDMGDLIRCDDVFWFPDYCLRDPWEELRNKGRVVFPRGE